MIEASACKPKKSVALSGMAAGNTAICTVGKAGNDLAPGERSYFAGVALHDGVAHADLAVASDSYFAIAAYRDNGCPSKLFHD